MSPEKNKVGITVPYFDFDIDTSIACRNEERLRELYKSQNRQVPEEINITTCECHAEGREYPYCGLGEWCNQVIPYEIAMLLVSDKTTVIDVNANAAVNEDCDAYNEEFKKLDELHKKNREKNPYFKYNSNGEALCIWDENTFKNLMAMHKSEEI